MRSAAVTLGLLWVACSPSRPIPLPPINDTTQTELWLCLDPLGPGQSDVPVLAIDPSHSGRRAPITPSEGTSLFALAYTDPLEALGLAVGPVPPLGGEVGRPLPPGYQLHRFDPDTGAWVDAEPNPALAAVRIPALGCAATPACYERKLEALFCKLDCDQIPVPMPPALPLAAARPMLLPCPRGWTEAPLGGFDLCRAGSLRCPSGSTRYPGDGACAPMSCADWPPPVAAAIHVDAAAPIGGDGTLAAPFRTIAEALGPGRLIHLRRGVHAYEGTIADVEIVGSCPADVVIELALPLRVQGATVAGVSLAGAPITVASGPSRMDTVGLLNAPVTVEVGATLELDRVKINGATTAIVHHGPLVVHQVAIDNASVGIASFAPLDGGDLTLAAVGVGLRAVGAPIALERLSISSASAAVDLRASTLSLANVDLRGGSGVVLDGCRGTLQAASISEATEAAISTRASTLEIEDLVVARPGTSSVAWVGGALWARRVAIAEPSGRGLHLEPTTTSTIEDLTITGAALGASLLLMGDSRVDRALVEYRDQFIPIVIGRKDLTPPPEARVLVRNLTLINLAPRMISEDIGGIFIDEGHRATLERIKIEDVPEASVIVSARADLELIDATISRSGVRGVYFLQASRGSVTRARILSPGYNAMMVWSAAATALDLYAEAGAAPIGLDLVGPDARLTLTRAHVAHFRDWAIELGATSSVEASHVLFEGVPIGIRRAGDDSIYGEVDVGYLDVRDPIVDAF